jgi:CheY-like chemotaxis protein
LSNLLGGEIQVNSQEGQGSTFTLYLPLEGPSGPAWEQNQVQSGSTSLDLKRVETMVEGWAEPHAVSVEAEFLPDDRNELVGATKVVLVIEDDPRFAKSLMKSSRKRGYKCLAAGDGRSGVLLATRYLPTAIILDIGLPDVDGLNVLDQLKNNLDTRHIPVHIISAVDPTPETLQKGAIGHLAKPVSVEEIDAAFGRLESVLPSKLQNVLVVEDDD